MFRYAINRCSIKPALLTLIGDHDDIERYVHGIVLCMQHVRQTKRFALPDGGNKYAQMRLEALQAATRQG